MLSLYVICLAIVYAVYKRYVRKNQVVAKIDGPSRETWLLGLLCYVCTFDVLRWFRQFGNVCRFKGFLDRDMLQIVDPKAIASILSQETLYMKDFAEKPRIAAIFGQGLFSSVGETHRRLRRIMVPAFAWHHLTPLAVIFKKSATDVRDRWVDQIKATKGNKSDLVNMGYDCSMAFLNALGEAAFGYDFDAFNSTTITPLFKAMTYIDSISVQRTYKQILLESVVDELPATILAAVFQLPIASGRQLKKQINEMRQVSKDLFELGKQDAESNAVSARNDVLSTLIRANLTQSPKYQLTAEEVQAQLMTFVTAGFSTVLSVHCQLFRQLTTNPECQRKLRQEMLSLGDHPSIDLLDRAEYLEIAIRESLRLTEFVPLERIVTKDCILPLSKPLTLKDGTMVDSIPLKKGQGLAIPITAISRHPDRYGPDAEQFKPERWLGEKGEELKNYRGLGPGSWNGMISFSGGERSCIGYRFGLLELKVFAHTLLTTFDFTPGDDEWSPRATLLER